MISSIKIQKYINYITISKDFWVTHNITLHYDLDINTTAIELDRLYDTSETRKEESGISIEESVARSKLEYANNLSEINERFFDAKLNLPKTNHRYNMHVRFNILNSVYNNYFSINGSVLELTIPVNRFFYKLFIKRNKTKITSVNSFSTRIIK